MLRTSPLQRRCCFRRGLRCTRMWSSKATVRARTQQSNWFDHSWCTENEKGTERKTNSTYCWLQTSIDDAVNDGSHLCISRVKQVCFSNKNSPKQSLVMILVWLSCLSKQSGSQLIPREDHLSPGRRRLFFSTLLFSRDDTTHLTSLHGVPYVDDSTAFWSDWSFDSLKIKLSSLTGPRLQASSYAPRQAFYNF